MKWIDCHSDVITNWRNRQGGRVPPVTSDQEICADLPGKERQGKKATMDQKRKKTEKGKVEKLEMEGGKVTKWGEDLFFFFFIFSKPLKFVLGLPNREISTRKKHFTLGKKSGKWLCPSEKYSCYAPDYQSLWTACRMNIMDQLGFFKFYKAIHIWDLGPIS